MGTGPTWAGVAFKALPHRDIRMIRAPGLFIFVRRGPMGGLDPLVVDHADCMGPAALAHRLWGRALCGGMNEVHLKLVAGALDRLQLRDHLLRRLGARLLEPPPVCASDDCHARRVG